MNENEKIEYPTSYYTDGFMFNGKRITPILKAAEEKYKGYNVILEYIPGKFVNVISTDDHGILRFGPESINTTFGKKVCLKYNIKTKD